MPSYNIHAGHNPAGKVACGAEGIISESVENRIIKNLIITKIKSLGYTVYDCTVDNGTSQNDVLYKIVQKCNAHSVDLDVSIHFNSGASDMKGNGSTTGVEVFCFDTSNTKAVTAATKICAGLSNLGFKNRGVKYSKDLYVLKNTNSQAILIEVCFVDDMDDVKIYNNNKDKIAKIIAEAITGKTISREVELEEELVQEETE